MARNPTSTPARPGKLRPGTRIWFNRIAEKHNITEEHRLSLLTQAGQCLDRIEEAREQLSREGLTVNSPRHGIKAHPAVAVERNCRALFCRLIKQLKLDVKDKQRVGRPGYQGIGITYQQLARMRLNNK